MLFFEVSMLLSLRYQCAMVLVCVSGVPLTTPASY